MDTLFQLNDEHMVELSENAQEHIHGGSINYDLDQDFSLEKFALAAVNGPGGSAVKVAAVSISSDQYLDLHI
ncbi:MAG: hypothetical protein AAGM36_06725 [Cyanobacteria bacterium J06597_1]